jgi:hypothetical protein
MSRFGELIGGKKAAPAPAPAPSPEPVVETVVEEVIVEEVIVEEVIVEEVIVEEVIVEEVTTEEDGVVVDFDTMSKRQLEAYGRQHGIELDRRHRRTKLVEELKEHLSNS